MKKSTLRARLASLRQIWFPPGTARYPLVAGVFGVSMYSLTQFNTGPLLNLPHHNLTLPIDAWFPFLPWTVWIYVGCFPFWVISYILPCRYFEKRELVRFFAAEMLARLVGLLIFLVFPTTLVQPDISGLGPWDFMMKIVYAVDTPNDLFPSFHILTSWMCLIVVRGHKEIPRAWRIFATLFFVPICISVLTTRQHVLLDIVAAIPLAEIAWQITDRIGWTRVYGRLLGGVGRE